MSSLLFIIILNFFIYISNIQNIKQFISLKLIKIKLNRNLMLNLRNYERIKEENIMTLLISNQWVYT